MQRGKSQLVYLLLLCLKVSQKTHPAMDLRMFITFTSPSMWVFWCLIRYEYLVKSFFLAKTFTDFFHIKFCQDEFILVSDLICK